MQDIDKVLELGQLEFKKKIFQLKEIDFKPNLIEVCNEFETLSKLQGIQFTFALDGEHYFIKAESKHLENVISNLLDNAQKYSENPIIVLNARIFENKLIIKITDNGVGISKKEKHLIFKKYYRVSDGNVHKVKGYGLGLSYVYEIIKKHKGKVRIDSELGKGTTVTISIPLNYGKR